MMTLEALKIVREDLGLTQTEMAEEIGLKLRAYQDIENGNSPLRKMHQLAVERVVLAHCAKNRMPDDSLTEMMSWEWFDALRRDAATFTDHLA